MFFLFNLFNHNELGRRSLEDVIMILMAQLRALGHRVAWNNDQVSADPNVINVVVEGFTPYAVELMTAARARGNRFLIVTTEEPTPKGFNHGLNNLMVERQRLFPEAARLADAIWALVPGTESWYGSHGPPAVHVELGHASTLERTVPVAIDHEFGFYGSYTRRRERIVKRLARRSGSATAVKVLAGFQEQAYRDREMSRAKVILQLRADDKMGLVSSSRCNTALHLGRPVIAEPHELSKPWDEIVRFSKTAESFYDEAIGMARLWQAHHAGQLRRFREMLSPERCVGHALRATELEKRRAA